MKPAAKIGMIIILICLFLIVITTASVSYSTGLLRGYDDGQKFVQSGNLTKPAYIIEKERKEMNKEIIAERNRQYIKQHPSTYNIYR